MTETTGDSSIKNQERQVGPTTLKEVVACAIATADHKQKLNGRYGVMADAAIKAIRAFDAKEAASCHG